MNPGVTTSARARFGRDEGPAPVTTSVRAWLGRDEGPALVTTSVRAWFGRDEGPPASGVSPIRSASEIALTCEVGGPKPRPNHALTDVVTTSSSSLGRQPDPSGLSLHPPLTTSRAFTCKVGRITSEGPVAELSASLDSRQRSERTHSPDAWGGKHSRARIVKASPNRTDVVLRRRTSRASDLH